MSMITIDSPYQSDEPSGNEASRLQPGFQFQPTEKELVCFYLMQKVENSNFAVEAIGEVNFNKCEPWDLWAWAKTGGRIFYFFSMLERKYNTGKGTNRATEAGFWKVSGRGRKITNRCGMVAGIKRTLVFYIGRVPKAEKTGWTMWEYRIEGESTVAHEQDWMVCKVFGKPGEKLAPDPTHPSLSGLEHLFQELSSPNVSSVNSIIGSDTGLNPSDSQGSYHGATHSGHESDGSTLSSLSGLEHLFQELSSPNFSSVNSIIGSDTGLNPSDSQGSYQGATHSGHESDGSTLLYSKGSDDWVTVKDTGFELGRDLENPDEWGNLGSSIA